MNLSQAIISKVVPAIAAFVAAALLVFLWQSGSSEAVLPMRVPAERGDGSASTGGGSALDEGKLTTGAGVAADLPGAWPGFRGPNRDGISPEGTPLADAWKAGEPRLFWSVELGEGYAGAAILNGRVYVIDYDREAQADAVRCLSLEDGAEIWRFAYPVVIKRNHGMSRTVPAVTDDFVISLGPKCHVTCLDAATGAFRWGIDLAREYGTKVPPWYAGQCPLIEDGKVIIAPAGDSLMVAVDCATGEVLWKTPNPRGWKMTHVSIIPMVTGGRRIYLYCGHRGVAGVDAADGSLLWDTGEWKISIATVATPVPLPGDRVFLSGGYKAGSLMLQLSEVGGKWKAEPAFRLEADVFGATQQSPILYNDHLYGVRPNGELVCLDFDGNVRWASGMGHRFGLGPYMIADGKIFVMDDHGELTMAEATPDGFRLLAQAKVLDGHDSWGPMAIAGGRFIVRDLTRMVCLDLRKK